VKKGSLHNEETPFSREREALLDRKKRFEGIHPLLRRGLGRLLLHTRKAPLRREGRGVRFFEHYI